MTMRSQWAKADTKVVIGVLIVVAVGLAILAVVRLDPMGRKGSGLSSDYEYDVSKYAYVDPNLILYEEALWPIDTGFAEARAIAIGPQGRAYVAGDRAIKIFDEMGNVANSIVLSSEPRALAITDDGTIFIAMKDHVEVYGADRKQIAVWKNLGAGAVLTSVALAGENVFVADAGHRIVLHYDRDGKLLKEIGAKDPKRNVPGFIVPSAHFDTAVAPDGLLRVVNPGENRVDIYTLDGGFELSWGERSLELDGFCGCCNPVSIAMLEDGSYITCEKGLVRVKLYDSQGSFVGVVASPKQLLKGREPRICDTVEECQTASFDVAVDSQGKVYVLDTIENTVRIFSKTKEQS